MPATTQNVLSSAPSHAKISVLVVADATRESDELDQILSSGEWEITRCRSASEAARFAGEKDCAVVVCDQDEFDGSWTDVLEQTRKVSEPPPLVVVASYADERLWSEVLNRGGYDVLPKPLNRAEVSRVIGMASRHRAAGRRLV